jgi:hypothetical protein
MTFSFPKKAFLLAHGNAVLTRAFRHLRDCDAAPHLKGASPRPSPSLYFT